LDLVARIGELAKARGVAVSQLALAWVLAKSPNIVPIPGTKRRKYPEENLGAAELTLSAKELAQLEAACPIGAAGRGHAISGNNDGDSGPLSALSELRRVR
jgi:aryl-alcohol dehydrogenase-like predicted oxidoreductase